ncbi:MAG: hypothetical protein OXG44_11830, partial [Gammaproteobacteria bacterium]|nr:hypothetical protein [Gammaproteobacteria bacterium]
MPKGLPSTKDDRGAAQRRRRRPPKTRNASRDDPEPDPPVADNNDVVHDRVRYAGFTEGRVAGHLIHLGSFMALGSVSMIGARMAEAAYLGILGTAA